MRELLICLFCLVTLCGISANTEWHQQLGTVHYPRLPELSPHVETGSVYFIHGRHFRAKVQGHYDVIMNQYGLPEGEQRENEAWREIRKGSYMNPKSPSVDMQYTHGDLYRDEEGQYFRAAGDGSLQQGATDFTDESTWGRVEDKAGWMGLLRDEIGDTRLGDIFFPGTHDTGTEGITDDSYLVDRNFLFLFAQEFEPQIITNWSRTQEGTWGEQCRAGFRSFDMRIADMEEEDGSFRWWHGSTGYEIQVELQEIVEFLEEYPEEILRMDFGYFRRPGRVGTPTLPIPNYRKDEIVDIILDYLGNFLVPQSMVSDNPTMNEVLATRGSIILTMRDNYMEPMDDRFWRDVNARGWSGRTNTEDLFLERSRRLEDRKTNTPDSMSLLSGCNTPNEKMILGGLLRKYGDNENITGIIEIILPELLDVVPDLMSFEGMWFSLLDFSRQGTNTDGMWVRPEDIYTNGASVHYRGTNEFARHWLARPQRYKLNELHVDDAVDSSTLVDTAIDYARGEIPREVTVAFQGNAKDGYYIWDQSGLQTIGGSDGLNCTTPSQARYRVRSTSFIIDEQWSDLDNKATVTFLEGEYPPDAVFELQVSGPDFEEWLDIYENVIGVMIEENRDLYLRGTNREEEPGGFAYTSYAYNLFGPACDLPPASGYLQLVEW